MHAQATLCRLKKPATSWFESAMNYFKIQNTPAWPDKFGNELCSYFEETKKINTLSLFSGGGGLDIAFNDAGFNIIECIEIEKKFVSTLEVNARKEKRLPNTKITCIDIRDYYPQYTDIDFIIGGPPCQTFSAAGARVAGVRALDDNRGMLFQEYVRILKKLQPKGFLFENVYRIVGAQNGTPWKKIQESFQSAGYNLFWRIIDAADYGVPQHRERLIIVGLKEGGFLFPQPTHGPDASDNRPYYCADLAVHGVNVSHCRIGINGRHGHLLNDIPPGLNYSFYTEKLGHPTPIFGWRSKFSDYLYKADPKSPVRTIKAQGGQYTGPFSWENRPFTINEYKRLQTFPDDYILIGNRQDVIAQLGNSLPPQCGRILALSVMDQIFNKKLPFCIKYLSSDCILGFRKRKSALTAIYTNKAKQAVSAVLSGENNKETVTYNETGDIVQYLSKEFQLIDTQTLSSCRFLFKYDISDSRWFITLYEYEYKNKEQFQIKIELPATLSQVLGTGIIILSSTSNMPTSLLALWKFLEKKINEFSHKDDLVQFFGYYQYRQESKYVFTISNPALINDNFWSITSQIINSKHIGIQLHINELCNIFCTDKKTLLVVLNSLKKIGYEIRSKNTNSQLKNDHYLIPYPFATLNKRSLQRRTIL